MNPHHLTQTQQTAHDAQHALSTWPVFPEHWPAQGDLLTWCQSMGPATAAILIIAGIVFLAFGIYIYRALVTINATLVGIYLGGLIGGKFGNSLAGAMVGGFLTAAATWPLMKYAVAIMGGAFGMLVGASIWGAMGLDASYAWAGGLSALIFFGMLSFILFRGSVMMFTSLQGAVMLVVGLLGMLYKYQSIAPQVTENLNLKPFILPMSILVPTIIGLIYQQTQYPPQAPPKK